MKKIILTFLVALIATFAFAQTKTEVKSADLPKKLTDYISQNWKGFTVDKAYKMDNKGEMTYIVIIMKGKEKHKMHFDKDGIYIKSAAPAEETKTGTVTPPKTREAKSKKQTPAAPPAPADDKKTVPAK